MIWIINPFGDKMVAFNMKSIAVLTAALMVCSISAVALVDNDDSSADAGKGYEFYVQLNDGTNSYSSWLGVHSGDSFGTALKDAFDKAGFIYSMSGNWISSITVDGVEYSSGEWGTDPYYGYAIYYSDGVKWVPTEEYNEGSMFAIVFDKYLFSAPENPDIYYNNYNYYYSLLPSVPVCSEWCFNLQLNNGTDSINTWIPSQDAKELTSEAFAAALKSALDTRGFTYDITETGWVKSITANGVEYKVSGTFPTDPYYGFAIYYAQGEKWVPTNNYSESTVFSIVLDQYQFSAPAEADKYYDGGWGYYSLLPTAATSSYTSAIVEPSDDVDSMFIYVAAAILAVLAIGIIVFALRKAGCS